ncbi:MAG TPA: hypothetical protein DCZ43_09570, partial [candidate division Zixibacteria bacterium]|nr:hypothetical protein [candidate division Zixibacteria bacterium]
LIHIQQFRLTGTNFSDIVDMMAQALSKTDPDTNSRLISYIFLALLLILAFVIGFTKINDHDIWWHLKTGEIILQSGIPHADIFSFTALGNHWVTHEWLAEVIIYLIYKMGGLTALIFFTATVSALMAFLVFEFGKRRGAPAYLSAALSLFMVAGLSYMMFPRPHAFGFIFLALLAFFLFKSPSSPKARKFERWLIIPLIFWIWANMHAGFILGLGVYWVVVAREFILPELKGESSGIRFKFSIAPALLATLLCLVNPNGIAIFLYPFQISGTSTFKSTIAEWVSPIYLGRAEWLAQMLFYIATALGLLATILHIKKRPDISIIIVVVELLACFARRNIQNFVIILAFGFLAISSIPKLKQLQLIRTAQRAILVAAAIWMIAWFALIRDYQADHDFLGTGIQQGLAPIGAANFLNKVGFEGNIVNVLGDGGYLIWAGYPRWKVFVDGRLDVYGEEQIKNYRLVVGGAPGVLDLLDQINAVAAVLPMPPGIGELRNFLSTDSRWSLVYFDDYYLVYLRRNQANQNIVNQWGYNVINPLQSGYGYNDRLKLEAFNNEAQRNLSINPESGLANSI